MRDNIGDYFNSEIIKECKDRGLSVYFGNEDITSDIQFQEMSELFLNLSIFEREKILNQLRNE